MPHDLTARASVRKLLTGDSDALLQHFTRLDAEARQARFHGIVSDSWIERHTRNAIRCDTVLYGGFDAGALRAVGELHPHKRAFTGSGVAEAAFSVEAAWQDHGLGTELFRRLVVAARNRGIRCLQVMFLPGNARMQRICEKFGARFTYRDGEVTAEFLATPPTPLTLWAEAIGDGANMAGRVLEAVPASERRFAV